MSENGNLDKENALNKIKKLFNLANAKNIANQNEAQAALNKAQELMIQYNVREYELHAGVMEDMGANITGKYFVEQARRMLEDKFICGIVVRFFNVRLIWRNKGNLYAVGTEVNLEIAENVYWYLRTIFRSLWLKYYYDLPVMERSTGLKQSYYEGLRCGLSDRLEDEKILAESDEHTGTALVWVNNALDKKYKEMFPYATTVRHSGFRLSHSPFMQGKTDSNQIHIRKGMSGSYSRQQPKLGGGRCSL